MTVWSACSAFDGVAVIVGASLFTFEAPHCMRFDGSVKGGYAWHVADANAMSMPFASMTVIIYKLIVS